MFKLFVCRDAVSRRQNSHCWSSGLVALCSLCLPICAAYEVTCVRYPVPSHSGVGKTSLIMRQVGNVFPSNVSPTIGASFFTFSMSVSPHTHTLWTIYCISASLQRTYVTTLFYRHGPVFPPPCVLARYFKCCNTTLSLSWG